MAYQTGTANNPNDLLDKVRVFAIGQGWTVNSWAVRSDGGGAGGWCLALQKGDLHVALYTDLTTPAGDNPGQYIGGYLFPTWSSAHGNMAQPNKSHNIATNGLGASAYTAYHLFGGAEHVHVVVEINPGTYKHFGFGRLRRLGAYNTGGYVYMSNWHMSSSLRSDFMSVNHAVPFDAYPYNTPIYSYSTIVRADSDSISPRYIYCPESHSTQNNMMCGIRDGNETLPILQCPASSITGRAVLWPILTSARRISGLFSSIGQPPDMRWVRLDYLNPGDTLTLGTDEWMVFPIIRKNGGVGEVNSGTYGIAYRK